MISLHILSRIPHQDQKDAAVRLDADGEQALTTLATMQPGDPAARATVRQVAETLQSLAMVYQVFPGDLRAAWGRLNNESLRLLNEPRGPSWQEDR